VRWKPENFTIPWQHHDSQSDKDLAL
jgi:hypothetical protein